MMHVYKIVGVPGFCSCPARPSAAGPTHAHACTIHMTHKGISSQLWIYIYILYYI